MITSKGNILIVDDTLPNLRLLHAMLTEQGYKVRGVPNGIMALDSARAIPPDLILLVIKMPDMSGYEVCQALKADDRIKGIPVIFISAAYEALDKVKAFTVGGVDYVTKPFQVEEVLVRVENQLRLRNLKLKLEHANDELEHRVEARTQELAKANEILRDQQKALVIAKDKAEEMSRLKSTFLTNMSHEIRTPLTAIIGFAGVLALEVDDEFREFAQRIVQGGQRLLATLNSVLDLSMIEGGGLQLTNSVIEVVDRVRDRANLLQSLADERGLSLDVIAPEE